MAQKVQIVPHNFWHGFTSLAAAIWFLLMHKASCISLPVAPIITSLILCLLEYGEISYFCKLQPTISADLVMHSDMYTWNTLSLLYIPGEPLCYGAHVCPGRPACCSGTRSCPGCTRRPHWQCSGPVALPAACSTADAPTQLREEMQWCKQLPLMIPQCSSQHCFLLSNIDWAGILLLGIMKCRGSSVYDNALKYDLLKSHFKW